MRRFEQNQRPGVLMSEDGETSPTDNDAELEARREELEQRGLDDETIDTLLNNPNATIPGSNQTLHDLLIASDQRIDIGSDGRPTIYRNPNEATDPNIRIQNDNAVALHEQYGYNVINEPTEEQLRMVDYFSNPPPGRVNPDGTHADPDYIIEGRVFDNTVVAAENTDDLWDALIRKVPRQTERLVLDLSSSPLEAMAVVSALNDPDFTAVQLEQLEEVIIMEDGEILDIWTRP